MIKENNWNAKYAFTFAGFLKIRCFREARIEYITKYRSEFRVAGIKFANFDGKFDYTFLTSSCLNILNIIKETAFCIVWAEKKVKIITIRATGDFYIMGQPRGKSYC